MITEATIEILDQGLSVLEKISDEDYDTQIQLVYGGTIGGHFRHVLEHFTTLYESHAEGFVNYDLRKRNESIEKDRGAAIQATENLKARWLELDPSCYEQSLEINGKLSVNSDESMKIQTSMGREVAYSIAHAHHHYAIIGVMCAILERPTGQGFGVAPSTVKYQRDEAEGALSNA